MADSVFFFGWFYSGKLEFKKLYNILMAPSSKNN